MQGNSRMTTEAEQSDILQRASRNAHRSQAVDTRRSAIQDVCKLLPSNYASINKQATTFLVNLFPNFTDLQETIINVAYDMVEAEESQREVRYAGYKFISALTKKVPSWARRNVDVLVQLLALDEPEDLRQLNDALADHIDVDPTLTLTVLCMYLKIGNEKSSVASTEDLRAKILSFLQQCTSKDHYIKDPNSPAGSEYRIGILNALPTALISEARIMVENLLLSIPLSQDNAGSLMEVLIEKAHSLLQSKLENRENATVSFEDVITISELSHKVFDATVCPSEPALLALAFYSSLEILSIRPQLPSADQVLLVQRMADYSRVTFDRLQQLDQSLYVPSRDRVAGDCPSWAKVILTCKDQLWVSAIPLLKVVLQRCQDDASWKPNDVSLNRMMDRLSSINFPRTREAEGREAQSIIKSIFERINAPPAPASVPAPLSVVQASTAAIPVVVLAPISVPQSTSSSIGKRKMDAPAPQTSNVRPTAESLNSIPTISPAVNGQRRQAQNGGQLSRNNSSSSFRAQNLLARLNLASPAADAELTAGHPDSAQATTDMDVEDDVDRPIKRRKMADRLVPAPPSLLARIGLNSAANDQGSPNISSYGQSSMRISSSASAAAAASLISAALPPRPPLQEVGSVRLSLSDPSASRGPGSSTPSGSASTAAAINAAPMTMAQTFQPQLSQGALPPKPSLSIVGAASNGVKAVKTPAVTPSTPSFSIKGAATGTAGASAGTGNTQSHGAVSFQRALASITQPNTSLDSLRPTTIVPSHSLPPPPPHVPVYPPIRSVSTSGSSLLARLTNGDGGGLKEGKVAAVVRPVVTSRSLSERMQMGGSGGGGGGEMDVDEPAQSGRGRRRGKGGR
ncbi:hypothetical protein FRB93_005742 [Tulasnella sp. JGI-2019a]|nr:hypothetical protein FRB93_005742 [Tulasnella sp. JGI-2019a]